MRLFVLKPEWKDVNTGSSVQAQGSLNQRPPALFTPRG